jgi:nucleobase:cation symporter-1, NCS1 family
MLLLILVVTIRILMKWHLGEIASVKPKGMAANPLTSYVIAVEMAIGLGVSWLFQFAAYGRICKSEAGAFYGSFIGWGVMWAVLCIPAMFVTYMTGESDPVSGLSAIGGKWMVIWLLMLCLANPSSLATNGYLVALMLRNFFPKLPWVLAVGSNFAVLILVKFPVIYDKFGRFMTILAAVSVSWAAVWVLDVVLRRYKLDLKGLYDESSKSPYYYYKGINPWVIVAVICGTATNLLIWTPWNLTVRLPGVFNVLGASIPTAIVSAVVYYVCRQLFLVPKRVGLPETFEPVSAGQPPAAIPEPALMNAALEGGTLDD